MQPPAAPPAVVAPALRAPNADTVRAAAASHAALRAAEDSGRTAYATPALRALVAEAALGNRVPPALASYRAAVETEFAVAGRRETGVEAVFTIEQIASVLRWTRAGFYEQHVVGDRARQTGFGLSFLSVARTGWATPVLYGNRLRLRRDAERPRDARRRPSGRVRRAGRAAADTFPTVHPLAEDRDRYYRYTGGDTVATARAGERRVPIVRVLVEPRADVPARTGLFRGEVDLDATTRAVVRLRGRFLVTGEGRRGAAGRLVRALAPRAVAYVEYVNAERTDAAGGRYWLPAAQRLEVQAGSAALGDARAVVRIVSRFTDMAVNDTLLAPAELAANADSLLPLARRRLTVARGDSLGRYGGWRQPLGAATADAHADDFADLAPGAAPPGGPPRADFFVPRAPDLAHFNRVDGVFTGVGGRVRFRDRAPGLTLAAAAGYAWGAETVRGRVELARRLGAQHATPADGAAAGPAPGPEAWTLSATAGRLLALTNDFRSPLDSGSSVGAVLGVDDYDYVDRRWAGLALARVGGGRALAVRLEAGPAEDAAAGVAVRRGLVLGGTPFRANRGVDAGRYLRTGLAVEWRPDVAAEFARPGLNARLLAERGDPLGAAGLRYTRAEGRLAVRREVAGGGVPGAGASGAGAGGGLGRLLGGGSLALAARADVGVVLGAGAAGPPAQQLFELGGRQGLFGYPYKAFAGDRAVVGRAAAIYTGPFLRTPLRVRRFVLPGVAPGVAVGAQAGRAEVSGEAARLAVGRLGAQVARDGTLLPVSRPSDGWRAGVTAGATFFGGSVFVGGARPVDGRRDRRQGWRAVVAFGQVL